MAARKTNQAAKSDQKSGAARAPRPRTKTPGKPAAKRKAAAKKVSAKKSAAKREASDTKGRRANKKDATRSQRAARATAKPAAGKKGKARPVEPEPTTNDPAAHLGARATQEILHGLAVGLTRLTEGTGRARHGLEVWAERVAEEAKKAREVAEVKAKDAAARAKTAALQGGAVAAGVALAAGHSAHQAARRVGASADEVLATARGISAGVILKAGETAEVAATNLQDMSNELANRARAARSVGVDFYERHREEIIALIITAAKIAAVIGARRLAGPKAAGAVSKRMGDAAAILTAVITQVGTLIAKQPSALPILREMYRKGGEPEQAVVGMLLGPAMASDPDHAVQVIREFLEGASSEAAADTIARRTLAPLLEEHPELVDQVTPWVRAAAPLVQRGALLALSRVVADRQSRLGDVLAAAVVVLEDHDEEVRQAVDWLMHAASDVDLEATAQAVAGWIRRDRGRARVVKRLPKDLARRVEAIRDEEE